MKRLLIIIILLMALVPSAIAEQSSFVFHAVSMDWDTYDTVNSQITLGGLTRDGNPMVSYDIVNSDYFYELTATAQGYKSRTMDVYVDSNLDSCLDGCHITSIDKTFGLTVTTDCAYEEAFDNQLCSSAFNGVQYEFVLDSNGQMNTFIPLVKNDQGENQAPEITNPSVDIDNGDAPLEVTFTATISDDDEILGATLFFGDGVSQKITGNSVDVLHTYTEVGVYIANLIVTDSNGVQTTQSWTITVKGDDILPPATQREYTVGVSSTDYITFETINPSTIVFGEQQKEATPFAYFTIDSNLFYEVMFAAIGYDSKTVDVYFDSALAGCSGNSCILESTSQNTGISPIEVRTICSYEESVSSFACYPMEKSTGNPYAGYFYSLDEDTIVLMNGLSETTQDNEAPVITASATPLSGTDPLEVTFDVDASDDNGINGVSILYGDGTALEALSVPTTFTHTFSAGDYKVKIFAYDNHGEHSTKEFDVSVSSTPITNQDPVAEAGNSQTVTTGTSVSFDGSLSTDADGTIVSYSWDFGDSNTGVGVATSHTYDTAATYTATLTITDDDGATDEDTLTIIVNDPIVNNTLPQANAGLDQSEFVGNVVSFDGSNSVDPDGNIVLYSWNFTDGTTETGATPTHTFTTADTYNVVLTVTDNSGDTDTDTVIITISDVANVQPVANAGDDITVEQDESVLFDGSSSYDMDGTIVSYSWDFGDGNTATGVSPTHIFTMAGTYDVVLTVTDDDGATDTDSLVVIVNLADYDEYFYRISAQTHDLDSGDALNDVEIYIDVDTDYNKYSNVTVFADFYDENGLFVAYARTTYTVFSHSIENKYIYVYNLSNGNYSINYTLYDSFGRLEDVDNQIIVIENEVPLAKAGNDQTVLVDHVVNFNGSESSDPDGNIVSYLWNFGDGNTATGVSPTHIFTTADIYDVVLTVTDNSGDTATDTVVITISDVANIVPQAEAGLAQTKFVGEVVSFDGSNSVDPDGNIVLYSWNFTDGTTETGATPTHTFTTADTYNVVLTVTDNSGDTDTDTVIITISDVANVQPVANAGDDITVNQGESVLFDGSSSYDMDGSIVSYSWNFGDGNTAIGVSPTHIFTSGGQFTVTLTVTDNQGKIDTDTLTATVIGDEKVTSTNREITMTRISTVNGEDVLAGDLAVFKFSFDNTGVVDLEDLKVTAMIPDLGILGSAGPFDLKEGDRTTKQILLDIPGEAVSGEEYMVRFKISQGGESFRTKHRFIRII